MCFTGHEVIYKLPSVCSCDCKLAILVHRQPTPQETVLLSNLYWGASVVTHKFLYLGITLTSLETWNDLFAPIAECRSKLNYEKPMLKLRQRADDLMVLKLSITASGQVWNVYLVPLLSYVA